MAITVELVGRIVVLGAAISLLVVGVAVLITERTRVRPEPVERAGGPLAFVNFLGIVGFVAVGAVCAIWRLGAVGPLAEPWDTVVRGVGMVTTIAAGLLAMWGLRSIGADMSTQAEVRPDTTLVTSGAFGFVRHPLYLSILLVWAGAALALLSWVLAAGWLVLTPMFVARSRLEERLLTDHFGKAYRDYARRVPMLLPRWPQARAPH